MDWDDDEYEDNSETYECLCVGCFHGEGWTFEAAPSEWFEARGLHLPSWCKECAEWRDEQKAIKAITAVCRFCKYQWSIDENYRIRFHRKTANWEEYWETNETRLLCRRCEEMPSRRRQLMYRDAERRAREGSLLKVDLWKNRRAELKARKNTSELFKILASKTSNTPKRYDIPAFADFYRDIPTKMEKLVEHGPNQLTHIMKPGHKWLEKFGTESPETVLNLAHRIANSTEQHVFQFVDTRSKMTVKYDAHQRVCIVLRGDTNSPTRNRLNTAFPTEPAYVINKLQKGEWL